MPSHVEKIIIRELRCKIAEKNGILEAKEQVRRLIQ